MFHVVPQRLADYEAAKESNLPSDGLHRPAGFEGQTGHQTPAAPRGFKA